MAVLVYLIHVFWDFPAESNAGKMLESLGMAGLKSYDWEALVIHARAFPPL